MNEQKAADIATGIVAPGDTQLNAAVQMLLRVMNTANAFLDRDGESVCDIVGMGIVAGVRWAMMAKDLDEYKSGDSISAVVTSILLNLDDRWDLSRPAFKATRRMVNHRPQFEQACKMIDAVIMATLVDPNEEGGRK